MASKFLTVQEALDYMETLDSDEFSADECTITCLPPNPDQITDEENFNENYLDEVEPVDVCGEVELNLKRRETLDISKKKVTYKKRKRCPEENYFSSDEDDCNKSQNQQTESKKLTKRKKKVKINKAIRTKKEKEPKTKPYVWKKVDKLDPIKSEKTPILEEIHPELASKTPYELFKMYFDSDIMNLILEETLRYATQNNNYTFSLSEKLLEVFLGILLFSGYHSLPQEDLYWSNSEDCNLPFIQNAMSRQRFRDIKKYLHLCDNNSIDGSDKLAKVRCFIELFGKKLQQFGTFSESLSIDEEMIPYTGRHSTKMYMRGKPIKFGYKLWILASSQGYPFNLQVYVGKETAAEDKTPLGTRVVLDLIECVENCRRHKVYVDNFFNSLPLLEEMRRREFRLTGTVRENRLQNCPLQDSKVLVKKERGTFDYIITKDLSVVKWKDNKVVCLASNFECMEPMGQAKRWCRKSKKKIDLPQPGIVGSYNKNMGGVDLLDRFLSSYRPRIKGKKWWWPFFTNTLNMAVVAAWRIHREMNGQMSQLTFLRDIVMGLMKSDRLQSLPIPQLGPHTPVNCNIRFDGVNHFITQAGKQSKCKLCKKNTRLWCEKCKVMLHKNCLIPFHTKM